MRYKVLQGLSPFLFVFLGVITPQHVYAIPIAGGSISFSNLQIRPAAGTVKFLGPWTAKVFAEASNSDELVQDFNTTLSGAVSADAFVQFANAHSSASVSDLSA